MSVEVTRLTSGLRIATHSMPHLETVSLGVWVGTGARFEANEEHGISHLLEHMAFKGTKTRSARAIVEEIENVGGDLNAATSLETTTYYARMLKQDLPLALDILSDILLNSTFEAEELRREQDVIIQEIAASEDSPDDQVYDLAQSTAYPDQPLGRPILGTKESVTGFDADALRHYLETHYTTERTIVCAAGAVDHAKIVAQAEEQFAALPSLPERAPDKATYRGGDTSAQRQFEQSHLLLGFEGPAYRDPDYYAGLVFSNLFGGGMSSRLFQEVREKRGLCYSIYSFGWGLSDSGMFGVHAATGAEQMDELASVTLGELGKLAETGPTDTELNRAKAQLKAGLLMSLESSSARAEQLARQLLVHDRPLTVEELTQNVENVSKDDIRAVAARTLTESQLTLATAGDRGSLRRYDQLQALCS